MIINLVKPYYISKYYGEFDSAPLLKETQKHKFRFIKRDYIMNDDEILLLNFDKIHTTKMGIDRIKRNLGLETKDVVEWCKDKIKHPNCSIVKKGKNFYVTIDDCIITVNSYSYTIITAHKIKTK